MTRPACAEQSATLPSSQRAPAGGKSSAPQPPGGSTLEIAPQPLGATPRRDSGHGSRSFVPSQDAAGRGTEPTQRTEDVRRREPAYLGIRVEPGHRCVRLERSDGGFHLPHPILTKVPGLEIVGIDPNGSAANSVLKARAKPAPSDASSILGYLKSLRGPAPGDLILKFNDTALAGPADLEAAVAKMKAGDKISLTVIHTNVRGDVYPLTVPLELKSATSPAASDQYTQTGLLPAGGPNR